MEWILISIAKYINFYSVMEWIQVQFNSITQNKIDLKKIDMCRVSTIFVSLHLQLLVAGRQPPLY